MSYSKRKQRVPSRSLVVLIAFTTLILPHSTAFATSRTVTDMRGKKVQLPETLDKIITLDDGFAAAVMTSLGLQKKLIAMGSHCPTKNYRYTYPSTSGEEYSYVNGVNPVGFITPALRDLPFMATSGQATNIEEIARLSPDLVIMRGGSCYTPNEKEVLDRQIQMIESIGIPLVALSGPRGIADPTVENVSKEIKIVGEIFGKSTEAAALAGYLEETVAMVESRTKDMTDKEKPTVLLFGLSPKARGEGGAGTVHGTDTIESFFLEKVIRATNAYTGSGSFSVISIEQVMAMNPDVIILPTAWGYHPPSELYTAPYYEKLAQLSAVTNRRVVALPWTPCNCAKRIEYPIELLIMAKACYPDLFKDIKINEWVLDFYQKVYGVDLDTAKGLRSAQWLDWTVEEKW